MRVRTNNGKGKSEIRGSLHCGTDDETVRSFGRDDDCFLGGVGENNDNGKSNGKGEIRGSLHCATDDGTVRCSGRDDECFALGRRLLCITGTMKML